MAAVNSRAFTIARFFHFVHVSRESKAFSNRVHGLKQGLSAKSLHSCFVRTFKSCYVFLSISEPFQDADINSLSQMSVVENVPTEIKMEKNGKIILDAIPLTDFEGSHLESLLDRFHMKGLKKPWMEKFNIFISRDENCMFFPLEDLSGCIAAVQYLTVNESTSEREVSENIFPRENDVSVFGLSQNVQKNDQIIVTSSPLDAIALNQESGIQAISVPFKGCFPAQAVKVLEPFQKVILWFRGNLHNWRVHKILVERLGKRVHFIRPADCPSTPLNSLGKGCNLKHIISKACPLKHDAVETFSSFKDSTYQEFKDFHKSSGVKWKRFPALNDVLKGLRRGELTVFSGQTGTGKTTFMSEYSLDLCMQGVPTLWGSFEITNVRLIKTMITQFSLCSFIDFPEKYHMWADEFQKLPMFFLNFCGQHSLKDVIDAMTHTVVVYDIEHVVIDNLQFMMNSDDPSTGVDQLRRQDQIFGAFRQFATQHNCHVTLVMHPRKEPEFSELNNTSISGSAKAIQEADNILLLQTTKTKQYLQITKNRFDGQKGCLLLEFNKKNLSFQVKRTSSMPRPSNSL